MSKTTAVDNELGDAEKNRLLVSVIASVHIVRPYTCKYNQDGMTTERVIIGNIKFAGMTGVSREVRSKAITVGLVTRRELSIWIFMVYQLCRHHWYHGEYFGKK